MYLKSEDLSPQVEGEGVLSKISHEITVNNPIECIDLTKDSKSQESATDKEIDCNSPAANKCVEIVLYNELTGKEMQRADPMSPAEILSFAQMNKLWDFLPELQDFTLFRKIGEGTFSSVYLACLKGMPEKKYAIKHHVPTSLPSRIAWELKCLKDIGGVDNVGGVESAYRRNDCTVFVMPYMPHSRFSEYVLTMGVAETREYIRNLLLALARVHSFGVIHRDVKPSNYLYDRDARRYMLVDFGLSCRTLEPESDATAKATKRKRDDSPDARQLKRRALQTQPNGGGQSLLAANGRLASKKQKNPSPIAKKLANRSLATKKPTNQSLVAKKLANRGLAVQKQDNGKFVWAKPANGGKLGPNGTDSPRRETEAVRKKLFAQRPDDNGGTRLADQSASRTQGLKGATPSGSKENLDAALPPTAPRKTVLGSVDGNAVAVANDGNRFTPLAFGTGTRHVRVQDSKTLSAIDDLSTWCNCYGKARVCTICLSRPGRHVPRAGTPGFRPPEVLFKYAHQTTAVDIWAAGVVMLCVMSGCYPFFKSPNDMAALAEITVVFGSDKVEEIASKLGRNVLFSDSKKPLSLRRLCESLRNRGRRPPSPSPPPPICDSCMQYCHPEGCLCGPDPETPPVEDNDDVFPLAAYDLLKRLLDLNPFTRISAADALHHPFFAPPPAAVAE